MAAKEMALAMIHGSGLAKGEAEKMMGVKFAAMTKSQRVLAACCLAAVYDSEKDIAIKAIERARASK